jgi:hypothetical protein
MIGGAVSHRLVYAGQYSIEVTAIISVLAMGGAQLMPNIGLNRAIAPFVGQIVFTI